MGKTRDLSRKLDIKGTFHAKMGTIKDRNITLDMSVRMFLDEINICIGRPSRADYPT